MRLNIKSIALCLLLPIVSFGQANAELIVGDFYVDANDSNVFWEYVGFYDLTNGPDFSENPTAYNGIDAANLLFGPISQDREYATTAVVDNFNFSTGILSSNIDNPESFLVSHNAYYDSFNSGIDVRPEDISASNDNDLLYNTSGDLSTFVNDRSSSGQFINLVFKSVNISEPQTLAIFMLMFFAFYNRRSKQY